jgi:Spy/CpxP family protein refolding chaperone
MKRISIGIAAIGALVAGLAIAQTAAPQAGVGKDKGERGLLRQKMLKELNLTVAQKQAAKGILQAARKTVQPPAQQLKQDRAALAAAIQSGDDNRIQQLSTEMGGLRGTVLAARSQAMSKFYALLTPEQKTKAEELRKAQPARGNANGE